jgi:hypothetical protein
MLMAFIALMATLVVKFFIFPSGETRIYLGFVIGLLLLLAEAATQAFQLVSAVLADVIAPNPRRTFPQVPSPLIRSSSVPSLS